MEPLARSGYVLKRLEFHACQLASNVAHDAPSHIRKHAQELIKQAYEQRKANRDRDDAFLANLLPWWQELAPAQAAILNAGKSHQERIVHKLSADIAHIRIEDFGFWGQFS